MDYTNKISYFFYNKNMKWSNLKRVLYFLFDQI